MNWKLPILIAGLGLGGYLIYRYVFKKSVGIETQIKSIEDYVVEIDGMPPGDSMGMPDVSWLIYKPGVEGNTLTRLEKGKGYWLEVSQDCILQTDYVSLNLTTGWNLIGWIESPATQDPTGIEGQVATIGDYLDILWGYNNGTWQSYVPGWGGDIDQMKVGSGYFLNMTAAATFSYGSHTYNLNAGWNLIGWEGR